GTGAQTQLDRLVAAGILRRRPRGWFWARPDRASDHVTLRGIGANVGIVERRTGRVLGLVDGSRADATVHAGAVYVHQGDTFVVDELDLELGEAVVVRGDPGWSTQARTTSTFDLGQRPVSFERGELRVSFGEVTVHSQVTSFLRRGPGGEVLGEHALDLPVRTLRTRGVWWTLPPEALLDTGLDEPRWPGVLHAAEHAMIGMLPLIATADRWDVGGVSTALHPDTGLPTVLVYDGLPGGAGFAERGYAALPAWVRATLDAVASCRCERGCPACVQSPKCGNGNEPLDKAGAIEVLRRVARLLS
ncbi:MAG: Zn-binding domain-containing protein, partial [Dermatophilaceae bacterium]